MANIYDNARFAAVAARYVYRELKTLRLLAGSKRNKILRMVDVYSPAISQNNSVYIVMERAPATLKMILATQSLTNSHVRCIGYQIAVGLKYLHSAGIVHRDLKPESIAVWEDCSIKIIDFRWDTQDSRRDPTVVDHDRMEDYIEPYHYWAPEVMLNNRESNALPRSQGRLMVFGVHHRRAFQRRGAV